MVIMSDRKTTKYGLGVFLGIVGGAIAGLFLAPKKGKLLRRDAKKTLNEINKLLKDENREKAIKKIFGKASRDSRLAFKRSKEILGFKLLKFRQVLSKIDKKKYKRVVAEVVEDVSLEKRIPKETLNKLQKYLESDFKKLKTKNKKSPV